MNDRVVEILGLDYRSFTTAVLLPQGDFAAFLKGDVKVRRRILIRLLDLDRFERAGGLARKKASDLRTAVEAGEELLAQEYGDATKQVLEEAQERAQDAEETADTAEAAYRAARGSLSERRMIAERRRDIADVVKDLETQEPQLEGTVTKLREQTERNVVTKAALKAAKSAQSDAREARRQAREAFSETVRDTGGEGVLATLKAAPESLKEAEQEIGCRSAEVTENARAISEAASRAKESQVRHESAQVAEVDATRARDSAVEARGAAEETLRIAERAATLKRGLRDKFAGLEALGQEIMKTKADGRDAAKHRDRREAKLQETETEHRAAALRLHLDAGDVCPVCGAPIDQLPATEAETESVLAEHRIALQAAQDAVVNVERRLSSQRTRREEGEAAAKVIERELRELDEPASLDEAKTAMANMAEREADAKQNLRAARKREAALSDELAEAKAKLIELQTTQRETKKARDLARARMEAAKKRLIDGLGDPIPERVEEVIKERRRRLQEATDARNKAEAACEKAEEAHRKAVKAEKVVTDGLADLDRQRGHHRTLLGERSARLRRLKVEVLDPPCPQDSEDRVADAEGLRALVGMLCNAAHQQAVQLKMELETRDISIRAQASDAGIDAMSLDAAAATSALEKATREARRTADQSAADVGLMEKRLVRKEEMRGEIEEKRGLMRQYNKVANELRTDRFIDFLLHESIQDLALRASDELKTISAGQYSLTSSKNSFTVVDHANADEQRSVVTLSGGETFLAALALALGLAQGIADIAGHSAGARLDAMFIDEGFGRLDPDSLDQAVEALERLRDGDRMVGIITHVPTLAERVPDGLSVERKAGGAAVSVR